MYVLKEMLEMIAKTAMSMANKAELSNSCRIWMTVITQASAGVKAGAREAVEKLTRVMKM